MKFKTNNGSRLLLFKNCLSQYYQKLLKDLYFTIVTKYLYKDELSITLIVDFKIQL